MQIHHLHETRLGPGRYAKSSYRVREKAEHDLALSFVASNNGQLTASVRQTWIKWNNGRLWSYLGPLVVAQSCTNQGYGATLLANAAKAAKHHGAEAILLVGDASYYQKSDYQPCINYGIRPHFPGPTDQNRALCLWLSENEVENPETYREFSPISPHIFA